jgi:MFS family permease
MSEKRIFTINFVLYLVAFISLALAFTQMIPFLIYVGYDPLQRGMILSTIAFVAFFGQLWSGYLCDRYHTVKRFFGLFWIVFTISSVLMYYVTAQVFFFHFIAVSFVGGLFRVTNGLLETWTIETSKKVRDNFGMIRAFGAIGWGHRCTTDILSGHILWLSVSRLVYGRCRIDHLWDCKHLAGC